MATITNVTLVDDLDKSPADETVSFGLDGKHYEIDLSAGNASDLRSYLSEFIQAGRKVGGKGGSAPKRNPEAQQAREWLRDNGYEVSDRGRVPTELLEIYRKGISA